MRMTAFDTAFVTAHYLIEERQRAAARAAIIAETTRGRRDRRAYLAGLGHLLVRLGERLQAVAQRPAAMEETVQW